MPVWARRSLSSWHNCNALPGAIAFHPAWQIGLEHELRQACIAAYRAYFGAEPTEYEFWDFGTNAVTPVSLGIPTIGFGPGEHKLAHIVNENCPVAQIVGACGFYTSLIARI